MKLVDPRTGEMEGKICGSVHWANLKPGGKYYRRSWQCQNGCAVESHSTIVL